MAEDYAQGQPLVLNHGLSEFYVFDYATMPDGRLVVVGNGPDAGGVYRFVLARFLADGTPDPSFGNNGLVVTGQGVLNLVGQSARGAAIAADGSIVTAGSGGLPLYYPPWVREVTLVRRFLPDGQPDLAFGDQGAVTLPLEESARGLTVHFESGRIVIGGHRVSDTGQEPAFLWWLNTDGRPLTTIGQNGLVALNGAGGITRVRSVAALNDGHSLVYGTSDGAVGVWRITPEGALDPAYGSASFLALTGGPDDIRGFSVDRASGGLIDTRLTVNAAGRAQLEIRKYDAAGRPVTGFGQRGLRVVALPLRLLGLDVLELGRQGVYVLMRPPLASDGLPALGLTVTRVRFDTGIDRGFGNNGLVNLRLRVFDGARLVQHPDGGFYVPLACTRSSCSATDVARLVPATGR